jgi:hypothetical protein
MVNENTTSNTRHGGSRWILPLLLICAVGIAGLGYSLYSTREAFQERTAALEATLESTQLELSQFKASSEGEATELASNLDALTERLGVTSGELTRARQELALRIRRQQEEVEQKLAAELAAKANSTDVDSLRQEATSRLVEAQRDATAKLGHVSTEVNIVKEDLDSTRRNLTRELSEVRTTLGDGIARNTAELAQLRVKGEREYIDVEIQRNQKPPFQRVGDIQIALTKTDPKRQKYTVVMLVDDNRLEKKDRTANEPVPVMVGRNQLRYELVVFAVDKDRIRGYLSTPKDKVLSAEGPTLRD